MQKKVSIYYLYCPIRKRPFYVGATIVDLKARLVGHMNCTMSKRKTAVINVLKRLNLKPEIRLIEEVDDMDIAGVREKFYYDLFTGMGIELVNDKRFFNYGRTTLLKGIRISNRNAA